MIRWLCEAFGFELRLKVEGEGGSVDHSELTFGDGLIMVGPQRIVAEPELHDHGEGYWADRSYGAVDPEGHLWWISQRIRG